MTPSLSNWQSVARKDFEDAVRSKLVTGLMALFVVFILGGAVLLVRFGNAGSISTGTGAAVFLITRFLNGLFFLLPSPVTTILPIAAIAVTYRAIAGERESGSIKLLLSLPHSRADALVGKFVGRTGVVAVPVGIAVVLGALYTLVRLGTFSPLVFLPFVVVTLAYAAVWVAIGVAVSAAASSTARAALGSIAALVLFKYAWGFIHGLLVYAARGGQGPLIGGQTPNWSRFLRRLNPEAAYTDAVNAMLRYTVPPDVAQQAGLAASPNVPVYLRAEWGLLLLVLWIVVPLGLAYLRFEASDL